MAYYVVLIPPRTEGGRQFIREVALSTQAGAIALTEAHRQLGYTDADWFETTGSIEHDTF